MQVFAADDDANEVSNPTIKPEKFRPDMSTLDNLLRKGCPSNLWSGKTHLVRSCKTLFITAHRKEDQRFQKAWTAKEQEFWAPIKVAKAEIPEFVAKQDDHGINERLLTLSEYERAKLMGALDDVSVTT